MPLGECSKHVQGDEWKWTSEKIKGNRENTCNFGLMDWKLSKIGT